MYPSSDSVINSSLELIDIAKESYGYFKKTNIIFDLIKESVEQYIKDVKSGDFPNENEQY